jgi:hypothetical protein
MENEYKNGLKKHIIDEIINVSLALFKEIKINGIVDDDGDMLLFQYGTHDWGNGKYFEFDITRQFIKSNEDEPYQLSMTLFFEPVECKSYNCWSNDFENIEKWVENIKGTEGYKLGKNLKNIKFEIGFEQC